MNGKVALLILDGWGHGPKDGSSAIAQADTPFVDSLYNKYPNTELITHGESVGLPEGQMGNSEVGHLNIGAGRIVYQELMRINLLIKSGELKDNPVLQEAFRYEKANNSKVHFIGLVSDGGVHSHIEHLKALCSYASEAGLSDRTFVHAFTDGRDCDPKSGLGFIQDLDAHLDKVGGKIASVSGRYYAMDRDNRWERIKLAYDALVNGVGKNALNAENAIKDSYSDGVTDEFVMPTVITDSEGNAIGTIEANDVVICFNFRTDRCRQITKALTQQEFPEQDMHTIPLHYLTMTNYDDSFEGIHIILEKDDLSQTLGETLAKAGKTQLRIAETEKYPHVTFFFNGGREVPFEGEDRIMIPSPKVATYDLQPEMSAYKVTEAVLEKIENDEPDFICLNYANADMVGHTGIFEAGIKAAEAVDECASKVVKAALDKGYTILVTADHGNADYMVNEDGSPNTAHTMNPVPFFVIDGDYKPKLKQGKLGDIAPTILKIMGLDIPELMTGEVLVENHSYSEV